MEWSKRKKFNPNGPGYPEAGYWYVLESEAEERIAELEAEVENLKAIMRGDGGTKKVNLAKLEEERK